MFLLEIPLQIVQDRLASFKWEVFQHPQCSPDLAPTEYHLFPKLKVELRGDHFESVGEVKQAILTFVTSQLKDFYACGIHKLSSRYPAWSNEASPLFYAWLLWFFVGNERLKLWYRGSSFVSDLISSQERRASRRHQTARIRPHTVQFCCGLFCWAQYILRNTLSSIFLKLVHFYGFQKGRRIFTYRTPLVELVNRLLCQWAQLLFRVFLVLCWELFSSNRIWYKDHTLVSCLVSHSWRRLDAFLDFAGC